MGKDVTFEADRERGKVGERVVEAYFKAAGAEIRDLSEDSAYHAKDIDFIAADGITYEVKTDYMFSRTGNLALEDSVYSRSQQELFDSWLWTSKADWFCFVNPNQTDRFVAISAADLRHLVKTEHMRRVEKESGYKVISLILLPYEKYRECFTTYKIEEGE